MYNIPYIHLFLPHFPGSLMTNGGYDWVKAEGQRIASGEAD